MPFLAISMALALARGLVDKRSWAVVVALQAVVVLGGFVAMNTGETEEATVKRVVDKRFIHEHEERAEAFVYTAGVTLVISAVALLAGPQRLALVAGVAAVGTVVSLALAVRTGEAGGELVFKHGAASAYATPKAE